MIKEIERQISLSPGQSVMPEGNSDTVSSMGDLLFTLKSARYSPGQSLRQNELVGAIKQRSAIPGSVLCNFDLPAFYCWLNKPFAERVQNLRDWANDLKTIEDGVSYTLRNMRSRTHHHQLSATRGIYHQSLEPNLSYQLLQISTTSKIPVFPEVSAGKHRFSIRFLEQNQSTAKSIQTQQDVNFELVFCIL